MARIVVVGGSHGGLRVTEALFRAGWGGEVVVVNEEFHRPYTRPPLSKAALNGPPDLATLELKQRPEAAHADWRFGVRAIASDLDARSMTLSDGRTLKYDGLVAATGVRPRRLPEHVAAGGHVVRTYDDCCALQPQLRRGARVVIIGAGFIGCEIAATAVRLGCDVEVIAQDNSPMQLPLGARVGTSIQRRHEREGVRFHLGRSIRAVDELNGVHRVVLADDTEVVGDVLVQAVGSDPCSGWLEGNGLDLVDGVVCDNGLRMGGRPGAVAIGDLARFPNPLVDDVPRRVEHWQMAMETARRAATTLLTDLTGERTDTAPFEPLPSFWSDQYDLRLQSFGSLGVSDRTELLQGDLDGDALVGYYRGEHLVGALLMGFPRQAVEVRRLVLGELTAARAHSRVPEGVS